MRHGSRLRAAQRRFAAAAPEGQPEVVETVVLSSPSSQPSNRRPPGDRQFQELLVSLGVAQPGGLTVARLAQLSGVGRETWRRCVSHGDLCKLESVPAMGTALRACGRAITDRRLQETLLADLAARKTKVTSFGVTPVQSSASPADLMISVIEGVPDEAERDKFIRQVAAQLAARLTTDQRAAWVAGMFTQGEVAPPEETSRDAVRDGSRNGV